MAGKSDGVGCGAEGTRPVPAEWARDGESASEADGAVGRTA